MYILRLQKMSISFKSIHEGRLSSPPVFQPINHCNEIVCIEPQKIAFRMLHVLLNGIFKKKKVLHETVNEVIFPRLFIFNK